MRSRMIPVMLVMLLTWALSPGVAHAVALGKIDVTSHLGEAFYAEVPLHLEKAEKLSNVTVEIAQPGDYRILEVYRDPVLNNIRTDIQDDARGPRIKLVSDAPIESPFFSLVLKVHYGNATSFKKYPVFLDLPTAVVKATKPAPKAQAPKKAEAPEAAAATPQPVTTAKASSTQEKGAAPFKPYSGWARIDRYGPMVYGDTLMTVARRLRVDDRYTIKQVMVALFDKNKDKFDKENMNLIKAGSYLKVPTAKEVAAITPKQARKVVAEQERKWQELKQQPRYAAVDHAQKTRYSARVKIGETAEGVPAAPAPGKGAEGTKQASSTPAEKSASAMPAKAQASGGAADGQKTASELQALQQQNAELQKKLQQADQNIAALNAKLSSPDMAASNARIKKLELRLARMQTQLDTARQQAAIAAKNSINNWLVYGLGGLAVLLLAVIGYLLRRERPHPASQLESESEFDEEFSGSSPAGMFGSEEESAPQAYPSGESDETPFAGESALGGEEEPVEDEAIYQQDDNEDREAAFQEVDQNVDYVAEADVYLRYGMEEEALRQLEMAIRQSEDNVDAHCKLIKLLQGMGDQGALDAAIEDGRRELSGDALARFESEVALLGSEQSDASSAEGDETEPVFGSAEQDLDDVAEDLSGSDTVDVTGVEAPVEEAPDVAGEVDLSGGAGAGLDLSELDWSLGGDDEEAETDDASAAPKVDLEAPAGDEEGATEAPVMQETQADEEEADAVTSDQDEPGLDWSFGVGGIGGESSEMPEASASEEEPVPEVGQEQPEGGDEDDALNFEGEPEGEGDDVSHVPQASEEEATDNIDIDLSGLMIDEDDVEAEESDEAPVVDMEDHQADDVSRELDELLDELGIDSEVNTDDAEAPSHDDAVSAGTLRIDMARSQLAQGMLDDAEEGFQSALDGDARCQGLLGLAEIAQHRGHTETAVDLLSQAEPLIDEDTREWFERLKGNQGE